MNGIFYGVCTSKEAEKQKGEKRGKENENNTARGVRLLREVKEAEENTSGSLHGRYRMRYQHNFWSSNGCGSFGKSLHQQTV
jgi:hypothetical protein